VARDQAASLRESLDLAAESLRRPLLRYQAGEAGVLDVVDAQTTLRDARNAYDDDSYGTAWRSPRCRRYRDSLNHAVPSIPSILDSFTALVVASALALRRAPATRPNRKWRLPWRPFRLRP